MRITPLSDVLGAAIEGIDLAAPLDDEAFAAVEDAFNRHSVLVFRDQRFSPEDHIAFSRRFGDLQIHVQAKFHHPRHPEILIVSNIIENDAPIGLADAGRYWHSDLSYMAEPSMASLLHAQEIPAEGGDTLFQSTAAAYDALDPGIKARLTGLMAIHDYDARNRKQNALSSLRPQLSDAQRSQVPSIAHPVVTVHPATRRRTIFVNEGFTTQIVGLEEAESSYLLELLFAHVTRPEFGYRHQWQEHDLVMWDNRATQHLAAGCPPHMRRKMYRTTVAGSQPIAAS